MKECMKKSGLHRTEECKQYKNRWYISGISEYFSENIRFLFYVVYEIFYMNFIAFIQKEEYNTHVNKCNKKG